MIKEILLAGSVVATGWAGYTAVQGPQDFEAVETYEVTAANDTLTEAIALDDINKGISYPTQNFEDHGLDLEVGDVIKVTWHEDAYHNGNIVDDFAEVEEISIK